MIELADNDLLRAYWETGSESSFGALVRRHLNLVFSTAVRACRGNQELAKDVSQSVFILLANEAEKLQNRTSLAGWLYLTTQFKARNAMRLESRHLQAVQEFTHVHESVNHPTMPLPMNHLETALDDALLTIEEPDREAVLLRVVNQQEYRQVGNSLGISEEAARKRVDRALEKIRQQLARNGIGSSTASIALTLASLHRIGAPDGLEQTITSAAIAHGSAAKPFAESLGTFARHPNMAASIGIVGAMLTLGVGTLAITKSSSRSQQETQRGAKTGLQAEDLENEIVRRKWSLVTGNPAEMADPQIQRIELLRLREQLDSIRSGKEKIDTAQKTVQP